MRLLQHLARLSPALALAAAACDGATEPGDVGTIEASLVSDGTPAAVGLLGFLNAPTTTVKVLDDDAALDARAAQALAAHRDGRDRKPQTADDDRFDTIAEVDAVAYVGTAAFDKLLSYCASHGYLPQGTDVLGTWDDVSFTVAEAEATLALANTATKDHLDKDLGMNARAVTSILAARPLASVLALSKLQNVGTVALRVLKQAATTPAAPALPAGVDVAAHLGVAADGLWHTSESDYPFVVVRVPGAGAAAVTADNVKALIAGVYVARPDEPTLAERAVEVTTLAAFFDRYTVPQDWWEDSQKADQPKWQALRKVLESELVDVQVFRFGERSGTWLMGAIDVYILGRTVDGELVGLSTISVET